MFEAEAVCPKELLESFLHHSVRETNILVRASDGHLALAGFKIHNHQRHDGHWEIEVKTDGEWIPGFFHPGSQMIKVWKELRYH